MDDKTHSTTCDKSRNLNFCSTESENNDNGNTSAKNHVSQDNSLQETTNYNGQHINSSYHALSEFDEPESNEAGKQNKCCLHGLEADLHKCHANEGSTAETEAHERDNGGASDFFESLGARDGIHYNAICVFEL